MLLYPQIIRTLRSLSVAAVSGIALVGCEAAADDKKVSVASETTKTDTVTETAKVTREQCIALMPDKAEVKACMIKLSSQNKAEIAALDKKIEEGKTTVDALTKVIAIQEEPNR